MRVIGVPDARLGKAVDRRDQPVALREQRIRLMGLLAHPGAGSLRNDIERPGEQGDRALDPGRDVRFRRRPGREIIVVRRPRQNGMHFAQALADGGGEVLAILDDVVARVRVGIAGAELVDGARQEIERPGPGVALIAHEALRHRERVPRSLAIDAHDFAEMRRRVGKRLLGQVAAHFRLGMLAAGNAPEHLEHHRVADDQRRVRLLGRQPDDLAGAARRQRLMMLRCRLEVDRPFRRLDLPAIGEHRHHVVGKTRQRECVGQQPDAAAAPHARQRELVRQGGGRFVLPQDRQRQQPARGATLGLGLDLREDDVPVAASQRCEIGDLHMRCSL